ncbi:MAG: transposase [Chloroflexi bacterium]|nr:transposase [Chloroflexota bacterium]
MHIIQSPLFDFEVFISKKENSRLVKVLEVLPAEKLLIALEQEHWTGRKGYLVRGMWAAMIAGLLNNCHSLAAVVRLLKRDKETRLICGFSKDNMPAEDALGRFLKKLVKHVDLFDECLNQLVNKLRELLPGFGAKLAIDSTDILAYSNGHRTHPSDTDASWGAKKKSNSQGEENTGEGGSRKRKKKEPDVYYWFGYKLHLLIDALYELPITFVLTPANEADTTHMKPLIEKAGLNKKKTNLEVIITDKGYDRQGNNTLVYKDCKAAPIIPIRERKDMQLPDICNAKGTPLCSCGLAMVYWGRDGNYLKYRCPHVLGKSECKSRSLCTSSSYGYVLKLPIAVDVRRHPPIPRESRKWERLYKMRTAVERVNSRVKGLLGLNKITVRGIAKVTVRAALSLLIMLAAAVSMAQEQKYDQIRSLVT